MNAPHTIPVALTVAGSDSGGGAGIQADLRAFQHFGVFGACAITAVTAQNPHGVLGVTPIPPDMVETQLRAIGQALEMAAIKTGMLFSAETIRATAAFLRENRTVPTVVDPVMVATSGARLLRQDAVEAMRQDLAPEADLITPNLAEAQVLAHKTAGIDSGTPTSPLETARRLRDQLNCSVLVTGGDAGESAAASDVLATRNGVWRLTLPRLAVCPTATHGTGCSLSAAIAAGLAQGKPLIEAVCQAKAYVHAALQARRRIGRQLDAMVPPQGSLPDVEIEPVEDS